LSLCLVKVSIRLVRFSANFTQSIVALQSVCTWILFGRVGGSMVAHLTANQ
jgi:hypothetical protein